MIEIWQPATAAEQRAARRLHLALEALEIEEFDAEVALAALENLGRACVAILGANYEQAPERVSLTDLVRTMSQVVAPTVARWAGTDPEDTPALVELPDDLHELAERTAAVRHQLASVILQAA